jgi:enamine deaminase RidA (YjgF/YER057c/UK114 family)
MLEVMEIEQRLSELGLDLPSPMVLPPGVEIPFAWVRVRGDRAYISGHGALQPNGSPAGPFGKVPVTVSLEAAQQSAGLATLAMLASLRRALGDLDRVSAWLVVNGYVNAESGYAQTTAVLNPCSSLILELYGDAGVHARTAIGVAALPLELPVVISAEVEIAPQ